MDELSEQLLEAIRTTFLSNIGMNPKIKALWQKIRSKKATYAEAAQYANLCGQALAKAFAVHLSADAMPGGKMYYDLASAVISPLLELDHGMITKAAVAVQESLNKAAGINVAVKTAPVNRDRIKGIIAKISEAENFNDVKWMLDSPVVNYSQTVVLKTIQANVAFQHGLGLKAQITRLRSGNNNCEWCQKWAGVYDYPAPKEVWQQHNNCSCYVEYIPRKR